MRQRTKHLFILFGIAVIVSYILVMLGSQNWLGRMADPSFHFDWTLSAVSAFLVLLYFDWINRKLNRQSPWSDDWKGRLLRQFVLLFVVPAGMAILITWLQYTFLYDQDLITHEYFQNEFVVTLLIICMINLGYFIAYLLGSQRKQTPPTSAPPQVSADEIIVIGQKGTQKVPVHSHRIAYIRLNSRVVFLTTFDNETLIMSENLDYYEQTLPPQLFFRANRQIIIHRDACRAFEPIENGKIRLDIQPASEDHVTVSQKKASKFRDWIRN